MPGARAQSRHRAALLEQIRAEVALTSAYTGRDRLAPAVYRALSRVPRHRFVPAELESFAYLNEPQPIGFGQTISQPFIVALMTDLAALTARSRVLEIGTGSGYQAAVLAEIAHEVYTIERVDALAKSAAQRLKALGYRRVKVRSGDGYDGWPEQAPFDAVLVTAAAPEVPAALLKQLKVGGRLVMPLGEPDGDQQLVVITTAAEGGSVRQDLLPVRFVPFLRGNDEA